MSKQTTRNRCECCGKARDLNEEGYCALCEHRSLECDGYAQETLVHVLEVTVEKMLEYVAPGDIFEAVHNALEQSGRRDGANPIAKTVLLTQAARERAERELVPA